MPTNQQILDFILKYGISIVVTIAVLYGTFVSSLWAYKTASQVEEKPTTERPVIPRIQAGDVVIYRGLEFYVSDYREYALIGDINITLTERE